MQTFLPDSNFSTSARVLDRARLGKQRVETMQIMQTLTRTTGGWVNHPAVKMWRGYAWALLQYQRAICNEWTSNRGYKDTCLQKTIDTYNTLSGDMQNEYVYPPWYGRPDVHESHKSNLIRKKEDHYKTFWPNVSDDLEYVWPV